MNSNDYRALDKRDYLIVIWGFFFLFETICCDLMLQTVYSMLRLIFNDIKTEILSTETSVFLKQIVLLKLFNTVLYMLCNREQSKVKSVAHANN